MKVKINLESDKLGWKHRNDPDVSKSIYISKLTIVLRNL